jgi:hypothetical protein
MGYDGPLAADYGKRWRIRTVPAEMTVNACAISAACLRSAVDTRSALEDKERPDKRIRITPNDTLRNVLDAMAVLS